MKGNYKKEIFNGLVAAIKKIILLKVLLPTDNHPMLIQTDGLDSDSM